MRGYPAILLVLFVVGCGSKEPMYLEQPLSAWINAALEPTSDPALRYQATQILADNAPNEPTIIPAMIQALRNGNFRAAEVLGKIGTNAGGQVQEVVAVLTETVRNKESTSARTASARALPRMGPTAKVALPALVEMLKDNDANIRAIAAETIGKLPEVGKEATGPLLEAMNDPIIEVNQNAKAALERTDPEALKKKPSPP